MPVLITVVLGLAVIALVGCATATPTATPIVAPISTAAAGPTTVTPPLSSGLVNACIHRAPEPTATQDLTTPTPSPFPNATPVGPTPEMQEVEIVAYPDLPLAALPASVEAWEGAVVRVSVELANGRTRDQQGLVVADGAVLTVLNLMEKIASLSVKVSGRGTFAAELERFDLRNGAALLTVEAEGLTVAPGEHATVAPGEPVLLLSRDQDGSELIVEETYASPSLNAPDHLFALHGDYTPSLQRGTIVVLADGTPVGLAGHTRRWYGQKIVWGPIGVRYLPAVLLDSALRLLELAPSDADITPAAVVYHGPSPGHVDGPLTRELLAGPVQAAITDLGERVPLEDLGRRWGSSYRPELGTMLELLYATPQELRGAAGELLGSARYIALWWAREGGAPDLVLCGAEDGDHLGAAYATHGLGSFEAPMEEAPSSSPHSMVAAAPLHAPDYGYDREHGYSSEDYQYPYAWELTTDKSGYVQGETVKLTFTVTNTSDWPVPLDYAPPRVVIRSVQEHRDVAVFGYGEGRRVLQPGEIARFTMTWDQVHFEGGRAAPGHYVAQVHLANLANNWLLTPGPKVYEVTLE